VQRQGVEVEVGAHLRWDGVGWVGWDTMGWEGAWDGMGLIHGNWSMSMSMCGYTWDLVHLHAWADVMGGPMAADSRAEGDAHR